MARLDQTLLTQWITGAATRHPNDLDAELAARFGVTLRTARGALKRLAELQWVLREGRAARTAWRPGALRQVVQRYALDGLAEDLPWRADFAPCFALPPAVNRMVQHAFCELLNNAIEHSGGSHVAVSLRQTPSHVQLLVSDDGCGVFRSIERSHAIADPQLAMFELGKGKLTSRPAGHTGQGLFFTARLADVFDLHANEAAFQQRGWDARGWRPQRALKRQGTSVYWAVALDTPRTLETVRRAHSADGIGVGFERTVVPLKLLTTDVAGLESRAQARRASARLAAFARAELDFGGIAEVGHAFVDELFRVLPQQQAVELVPVNMSAAVAAMVDSVRPQAAPAAWPALLP